MPTRPRYDPRIAALALADSDPAMARLIERVGPCRLRVGRSVAPFRALLESIVYQQITGHAASRILGRVVAFYAPRRFPDPDALLETPEEALRAAGLSRNKVAALRDLSAKCLDGTVPTLRALHRLGESEIVERLTAVRGVGPWTVEMLLIFGLGRPDVLPATDYGVRKGFRAAIAKGRLPTPAQVLRRGERWRPYRSVAAWYLWRAADTKTPDEGGGRG
jgi:3-methyladenine DNA glycosylase/8-oxoguanine DNA glycosylase